MEKYALNLIQILDSNFSKNIHVETEEFHAETVCGIEFEETKNLGKFENEQELWEHLRKQKYDEIQSYCGICVSGLFSDEDCENFNYQDMPEEGFNEIELP